MSILMNYFFILPYWGRVALLLLAVFIVWGILSKAIMWILSIVPFLLRKVSFLLYQLVELIVSVLHKICGSEFYKVSNFTSLCGEKTDVFLRKWYENWHCNYSVKWKLTFFIIALIYVYMLIPTFVNTENQIICFGKTKYLAGEQFCAKWLEEKGIYEVSYSRPGEKEASKDETRNIELVVSGLNSSLLVRDIPDMELGIALDRLYNGDTVTWMEELTFAEAENNHVEAWVKIMTQNGVEGWSRLFFLHPTQYEELMFDVRLKQETK